jgi:2,4-dienoyl-CoA reductase-like NADH-dependent reductase (Old Yellow Enzyme family)
MRLKKTIRVPVMLVGGIRSYEIAANLVDGGTADLHLHEPRLDP